MWVEGVAMMQRAMAENVVSRGLGTDGEICEAYLNVSGAGADCRFPIFRVRLLLWVWKWPRKG
jgi:hypothetical protein